jgi:hypothetical protein
MKLKEIYGDIIEKELQDTSYWRSGGIPQL